MKEEKGSQETGDLSWQAHAYRDKVVDIQDVHLLTFHDKHSLAATRNFFLKPAYFIAFCDKCIRSDAPHDALCLWA